MRLKGEHTLRQHRHPMQQLPHSDLDQTLHIQSWSQRTCWTQEMAFNPFLHCPKHVQLRDVYAVMGQRGQVRGTPQQQHAPTRVDCEGPFIAACSFSLFLGLYLLFDILIFSKSCCQSQKLISNFFKWLPLTTVTVEPCDLHTWNKTWVNFLSNFPPLHTVNLNRHDKLYWSCRRQM